MLRKARPKEIQKIKVLDPACGSGSFLTAAYDRILETLTKQNPQTSLFAKFDILKDNIYGVGLDTQAVEIAQLNLLLKVLSQKTKLPTLEKLKEDKRTESFCVIENTDINKTRNDIVHKNAYRPSLCDVQKYDKLISSLNWLGISYLKVQDSLYYINQRTCRLHSAEPSNQPKAGTGTT